MQFAYEGFTHQGDTRYFRFVSKDEAGQPNKFCIAVRYLLFAENQVPLQAGPQFCLKLLQTASTAEPNDLGRFHDYQIVPEDFRPMLMERERAIAVKAMKGAAHKPFRKPSWGSQLFLGKVPREQ